MALTEWFKGKSVEKFKSFKENRLPSFYEKWEKDGFFWAIPYPLRIILLMVLIVTILIVGAASFTLGMSLSVLLLGWWFPNFTFLGLPLGLFGECRAYVAALYFAALLIATLALILGSWSRHLGDHWVKQEKVENLARKISEDGHVTQMLLSLVNVELNFFGSFYYKIHALVFIVSLVAFLVKG